MGLPLFYKLLPGSNAVACIVQFSIATLAWIVLGLTVARFLRHPMLKADTVQAEMRKNAWSAAG